MRDGGKGDRQRPLGVFEETFASNWDAIFKKKNECVFCKGDHPENEWCQGREDFRNESEARYLESRRKRLGFDDGWRGD